jgi:hypothetical protein
VELRSYKPFVEYVDRVRTQYPCQTCFCPSPNFSSSAAGSQKVHTRVLVSTLCIPSCSSVLFCSVARLSVGCHELPYTIRLSGGPEPTFRASSHGYVLREDGTHCILLIAHIALCKSCLTPAHCISLIVYLTSYILHLTSYVLRLTPYVLHLTSYTLRLTPYILHLTPYTLRRTPYTLHLTPYILHLTPYVLRLTAYVLRLTSYILHLTSYVLHLTSYILHLTSYVLCLTFYILHLTSYTLHLTPYVLRLTSYILHFTSYIISYRIVYMYKSCV